MIGLASGLNLVAFGVCLYAEIAMVSRRVVRSNTFNLYVIFLLLPDMLNNLIQSLQGLQRVSDCGKDTAMMSDIYDANIFFYYFCNFSMSCLVAYELHLLLERSRRYLRTGPPSTKRTLLQIAAVYCLAVLFALWGILDFRWSWWYRKESRFGSPPPDGVFNEIQAISIVAAIMLALITFVLVIRFNIWRKNLIPTQGRTRVVAIFFQHIVGVFLVFYVPSIALLAYSTELEGHTSSAYFWIERSTQLLAALQALSTVYVAIQKPDICTAFCCGREAPRQQWSIITGTGRAASQTQQVSGLRSAERENESSSPRKAPPSEGLSSPRQHSSHMVGSSEFVSGDRASLPFFRSSEWVMDDVYGDTQDDDEIAEKDNDVENAIEGVGD